MKAVACGGERGPRCECGRGKLSWETQCEECRRLDGGPRGWHLVQVMRGLGGVATMDALIKETGMDRDALYAAVSRMSRSGRLIRRSIPAYTEALDDGRRGRCKGAGEQALYVLTTPEVARE